MTAKVLKLSEVSEAEAVSAAVEVLQAGGLVVFPTETVYGLAVLADSPDRLDLIFQAKSRDRGKPVPLMASTVDVLADNGFQLSPSEEALAHGFWPGALTLVLKRGDQTEGVRIPDHSLARQIVAGCGGTLRVTSANQSDNPPALDAAMAISALGSKVDLVIDGGRVEGGVASTVVKCSNEGFDILREGAISSNSIVDLLEVK
jgi:L-threonylcarbamoyladenylate synthase